MFFTHLAALYSLLGVIFVFLFYNLLTPFGAVLLYNIIFLTVTIVDFLTIPHPREIKIKRIIGDKLSLGVENDVIFEIENKSPKTVKIQIKDEYPQKFSVNKKTLKTKIKGYQKIQISYKTTPYKRGEYTFGKTSIRLTGALQIIGRQFTLQWEKKVAVYPNLKEITHYRLLARKGHLPEAGLKPSKIYGIGTEFEYLREYQPDDEYRKINWKATARRGRLITSQYQTERSQNLIILIDAGRMMASMVGNMTKMDYAINATLLLSYVAIEKGDKVGLMVFSDEIKVFLPPKGTKKQIQTIVEALYKAEPKLVESDYRKAIEYMTLKNRKRSLVVLFTDLIDLNVSKALITYSKAFYPRHLPLCVTITDPNLLKTAEKYPQNITDLYKKAVAEDLIFHRQQVKSALHRFGVLTIDVPPNKLTPHLITQYLSIKSKNKL